MTSPLCKAILKLYKVLLDADSFLEYLKGTLVKICYHVVRERQFSFATHSVGAVKTVKNDRKQNRAPSFFIHWWEMRMVF